jgi:hypothetical protein
MTPPPGRPCITAAGRVGYLDKLAAASWHALHWHLGHRPNRALLAVKEQHYSQLAPQPLRQFGKRAS